MDSEEIYMSCLLNNLELDRGTINLSRSNCEDEEYERFAWFPGTSEVFDKKLDTIHEPLGLCMAVLECDEQSAIAWMKERDLA